MPISEDLNKNYNPNLFEFSQIGIKFVAPNVPSFYIISALFY
jgi:hypothetical protein